MTGKITDPALRELHDRMNLFRSAISRQLSKGDIAAVNHLAVKIMTDTLDIPGEVLLAALLLCAETGIEVMDRIVHDKPMAGPEIGGGTA